MITIRLFCAAGMSTSCLVKKMEDAAKRQGIEADIAAFPEGQMKQHLDNVDVALLGPQVGYTLKRAKETCEPMNIPVAVIPMIDYGMMNGEKVLQFAIDLSSK